MDCLKFTLLLASILMLFGTSKSDNSKDKEECAESLVALATCLPYVGGSAKAPTPDCCSGLKEVLKANKKCLCVVIKDRNDPDLGLNINLTLALTLPDVCHAPANISQCPVLLNLPPNSPDAQIFYQIGQNSSHGSANSPIAGGPNANAAIPTGAPAGAATLGRASPPLTNGCGRHKNKRWLRPEFVLIGLVLLQFLIL